MSDILTNDEVDALTLELDHQQGRVPDEQVEDMLRQWRDIKLGYLIWRQVTEGGMRWEMQDGELVFWPTAPALDPKDPAP